MRIVQRNAAPHQITARNLLVLFVKRQPILFANEFQHRHQIAVGLRYGLAQNVCHFALRMSLINISRAILVEKLHCVRLTLFEMPSGNRASISPRDKRIASRVLPTYVGTDRAPPVRVTFCIFGSPFSQQSWPMYSVMGSVSPVSARYKRKSSAPTADEMQLASSQRTWTRVGRSCSECVRSSSICRLSAWTQNFHLRNVANYVCQC